MTSDAFRWRPPDNAMNPTANTQVRAILRAEALMEMVWPRATKVAAVLFDPVLVPELAERVAAAEAEFRSRTGEYGDMHWDTYDTDYNPHVAHEQGVARVWAVGTKHCDIVRDRWHDPLNANRVGKPVAYFASMHGCQLPDFFDCSRFGCHCGNRGRECSVRLAKTCGGTTGVMPVCRGTLIMLFRCCQECETLAGKIAANNRKKHVIDARVNLPPNATIMPNPDPSINRETWA